MRPRRSLLLLTLLVSAVAAVGALASSGSANTVPGIPGDGNDEDTPFLPAGTPILHVHVNPHWFGYVRSTTPIDYLIDCPRACRRPVVAGTSITLEAHPQAGWTVESWSMPETTAVQCQGQAKTICSFTMPGSTTGLPATNELEVVVNLRKT